MPAIERAGHKAVLCCCAKSARGVTCEHLRDALVAGTEEMRRRGMPAGEARERVVEVLEEEVDRGSE